MRVSFPRRDLERLLDDLPDEASAPFLRVGARDGRMVVEALAETGEHRGAGGFLERDVAVERSGGVVVQAESLRAAISGCSGETAVLEAADGVEAVRLRDPERSVPAPVVHDRHAPGRTPARRDLRLPVLVAAAAILLVTGAALLVASWFGGAWPSAPPSPSGRLAPRGSQPSAAAFLEERRRAASPSWFRERPIRVSNGSAPLPSRRRISPIDDAVK